MSTSNLIFSLVVNTTDRAGPLQTLLRSLEHQSYPHFEVIVVVGPTRDHTLEMLEAYGDRVRILRCPDANLSQSRNVGLLAARGDMVAYIDDDAVPSRRWLEQLALLFQDPQLDATGGTSYLVHPNLPIIQHRIGIVSSLAEQVDIRHSWLENLLPPGEGKQWVCRMMGVNMAFRRQALLEVGGFDEFFIYIAEETDLVLRLANAAKIIHPVKEAPVYHVPASSRNRKVFSYTGKWWLQTRSMMYYALKNAPLAGDSARSIMWRCLHLVHGHWLWYGELRRDSKITFSQAWKMRLEEIRAAWDATFHGLFRPRQLINPAMIESAMQPNEPILPFQNQHSGIQPTVDPVTGYQPSITLTEPPLRLCLLSSNYPPDQFDGVGRLTHLMAQGLFELGHTVHVITRGDKEQIAFYDGAYVHKVPPTPNRYQYYQKFPGLYHTLNYSHTVHERVKRLMLNDGIQIVDSPIWQFEGLVTAISDMIPVVVRLVTARKQLLAIQKGYNHDERLIGDMEQALLDRATHLLPNTQATFDSMRQHYSISSSKEYTIVPYGIVPAPDDAVRPFDLKRTSDKLTVLFVGRLEKRKGILDLFQAIPSVLKQVPNATFIIAGADNSRHDGFQRRTGTDYPTYFANRYRKVRSHVKFMGRVSDETLHELYQSCDLFVAPSLYESFGLIYIEAMNYAKPVIGCRAGGIPEVIDDGVTGLLVDPGAAKALAEAIVSLLKSPRKLYELGMAGRQQVLEKFTYIQMARHFERVYRAVLQ
ncbi:MAG: glycosyltransferase [Ardenticatenaceae bacterium]